MTRKDKRGGAKKNAKVVASDGGEERGGVETLRTSDLNAARETSMRGEEAPPGWTR